MIKESELQLIKQRFGIIGNSPLLNRAIEIASQIANTDVTVLITGESGTGKEFFPQIIHSLSSRKHGKYIAVNCGAIPEGTIDSELFGHEKGSFTGAHESRKGYFEVANGGTIFLDEVADLPLSTQVRLLRVLESGEFIKVGASNVLKTNVRIVAATNINIEEHISKGKFREDLYYRLSTVPLKVPALRERKEDIFLLFRKFAADFSERYKMPAFNLDEQARYILENYSWPGNVRQLKNIAEQISVIEIEKNINETILKKYIPLSINNKLPVLSTQRNSDPNSDRDLIFKFLIDIKNEISGIKSAINACIPKEKIIFEDDLNKTITKVIPTNKSFGGVSFNENNSPNNFTEDNFEETEEYIEEESLSLKDKEIDMIKKALSKYDGKRNKAAKELGISDRTLFRKLKEYNIT
ncbi:MAG: sigma-54-dependent Fis family transcriptional regulator [Bacteroidetes bacterium GWE2_29_8]|nr:MAG: sigma-54-dependent Fis family transcriptional regulator [Bacteroidetes bacterium GWE2_29_8]